MFFTLAEEESEEECANQYVMFADCGSSKERLCFRKLSCKVVHQIFVLIAWRLELHYKFLTQELGQKAFSIYMLIFFLQFASRMVYLVFLAIANQKSFQIDSTVQFSVIAIISIIVIYAFYSIKKYFGMDRAAGLDHFDSSIASKPLVKEGIFKYTNNGMYSYAFLVFYLPAFIYLSLAALLVAVFSHFYIWVHFSVRSYQI